MKRETQEELDFKGGTLTGFHIFIGFHRFHKPSFDYRAVRVLTGSSQISVLRKGFLTLTDRPLRDFYREYFLTLTGRYIPV
jgi:hypothetical protein